VTASVIHLDLPYPPSVNHYYRHVGPRTLISREGRMYRERVAAVVTADGVRPLRGPIEVRIVVHPPDRRRRDLDNVLKSLLDALEHAGAYRDDDQVVRLRAEKRHPTAGGRVIVTLLAVPPCETKRGGGEAP